MFMLSSKENSMKTLDMSSVIFSLIFILFIISIPFIIISYSNRTYYNAFNKIDSFQYSEASSNEMILIVQKIKAKEDFRWIGNNNGSAYSRESDFSFNRFSLVFDDVQIRAKSFRDYRKYWKFVKELFEEDTQKIRIEELLKDK